MTKKISVVFAAVVVGASLFAVPSPSGAEAERSHLKCYRGRDLAGHRAIFSGVVLNGQEVESACKVYLPAKLCCDNVSATGIPPQPGGGGPSTRNDRFCCYRVRCPADGAGPTLNQTDEFGEHTFRATRVRYLCAPAFSPSGAFLDEELQ